MGSNTCFQLLQTGHHLIKFKNPSNSNPIAPERVAGLVGSATTSQINLLQGDMRNISQLDQTFAKASLPGDAFIHFAELRQGGGCIIIALLGSECERHLLPAGNQGCP